MHHTSPPVAPVTIDGVRPAAAGEHRLQSEGIRRCEQAQCPKLEVAALGARNHGPQNQVPQGQVPQSQQ